MNEFLVLVKKELKSIKTEKTILFAILIQFFIASFSSIMLVGVMAFYDPTSIGENTQIAIEVGVVSDANSSPIIDFVKEPKNVRVLPFSNTDDAERAFQSGHVDSIMIIPASDTGIVDMKLILPESDIESTAILMLLDEPLKKAENYLREANGVQLNYKDIGGKPHVEYEFLYSIIIPLLMFFPALIAGSIVIDTVSEEIENKTLDTLWAAPVSLKKIFSSKIFAAVITACLQCVLWIFLLRLNSFSIQNAGSVLMLSILIAGSVSFGAAIVGLHFKDRERSQFIYSLALLAAAGLSYLLDPSPFGLITGLATGDHYVGIDQVAVYFIPLITIATGFFLVSKKLVLAQN